jgi:hypothetical protein
MNSMNNVNNNNNISDIQVFFKNRVKNTDNISYVSPVNKLDDLTKKIMKTLKAGENFKVVVLPKHGEPQEITFTA